MVCRVQWIVCLYLPGWGILVHITLIKLLGDGFANLIVGFSRGLSLLVLCLGLLEVWYFRSVCLWEVSHLHRLDLCCSVASIGNLVRGSLVFVLLVSSLVAVSFLLFVAHTSSMSHTIHSRGC